MTEATPVEVVRSWHDALNQGNAEELIARVSPEVELTGPRGTTSGANQVEAWMTRAGMRLVPTQWFVRGDLVLVEEEAAWTQPDGTFSEPAVIAIAFRVTDGRIAAITRYGSAGAALNATGLQPSDRIDVEGAPSR